MSAPVRSISWRDGQWHLGRQAVECLDMEGAEQ